MFAAVTNNRVVETATWAFESTVSGVKNGFNVTTKFAMPYIEQGSAWVMRQPVRYQIYAAVVLTAVVAFAAFKISAAYSHKNGAVRMTPEQREAAKAALAKAKADAEAEAKANAEAKEAV